MTRPFSRQCVRRGLRRSVVGIWSAVWSAIWSAVWSAVWSAAWAKVWAAVWVATCCLGAMTELARGQDPGGRVSEAVSTLVVDGRLDLGPNAETVTLGAPFRLVIEARHPPGGIALLPETVDVGASIVERVGRRQHDRRAEGADEIDTYVLELLAFEKGDLTIPSITLALGEKEASTPALGVFVVSNLSDEEQARTVPGDDGRQDPVLTSTQAAALDVLDQMTAPDPRAELTYVRNTFWLQLGLLGLVLVGLGVIVFLLVRQLARRPVPVPPPPPPRPAHEVALEALSALKQTDLLHRGDFKGFYTELSAIVRRYVGERYAFESLELTFDELFEALYRRSTPGLNETVLRNLLMLADQVKFAKFVPRPEEGLEALRQAEDLVNATRPTPAPTLTARGLS